MLDAAAVPYLTGPGRAAYTVFTTVNLPRAFAVAGNGNAGWSSGGGTIESARAAALKSCAAHGATDCAIYAEDLDVVWRGRPKQVPAPPGPLIRTINYAFVPDARYFWRGPGGAAGVYVWGHGSPELPGGDARGLQPQTHVRWFNNAGFDVVRFDRAPMADERNRAAGWLRDGLAELRKMGYRTVITGGQSRGAWNSLQILDTPGLADVVIAISPAAHGTGDSTNLTAQTDDFRAMMAAAEPARTRVALAQFQGDLFMSDGAARASLIDRRLRPKVAALLLIDRPEGFSGHGAGSSLAFSQKFGACLLSFATAPTPPERC